ncbi:MAG: iron-sulfur cluster assembly scaffold protein [Pseudomonadota bacterium]
MSSDADLIKLYSKRILALAADMPLTDPLEAPDVSVKKRAPLCGSTVTVSLNVADGHITAFSQNVKACALGQASAALMARHVVGRSQAEIEAGRDALRAFLAGEGNGPDLPWTGYDVLTPARDYRNRHASIMLAFEATADALAEANASACA